MELSIWLAQGLHLIQVSLPVDMEEAQVLAYLETHQIWEVTTRNKLENHLKLMLHVLLKLEQLWLVEQLEVEPLVEQLEVELLVVDLVMAAQDTAAQDMAALDMVVVEEDHAEVVDVDVDVLHY